MKNLQWILPALALVLLAPGCILTSGQILIDFDLGDIVVTSPTGLAAEQIDLNTNDDYEEHKDKLKDIVDFAVLGKINNTGGTDLVPEIWMTRDLTTYPDETTVKANGIRLWGGALIPAGSSASVDWDTSARLFTTAGKAAILQEAKGDGNFTLYAIGASGTYAFNIEDGILALVIDAGI
jgi:hypothetical protein